MNEQTHEYFSRLYYCYISSGIGLLFISLDPPNIASPAAIVRTLPGYRVKFQVNGTTPIYIAIIRNSTVLANTTNTGIVSFSEEGNYTCEAISQYGTDVKNFSVILNGKNLAKI